ncbi:hypothetical protein A1O7_04082 [Cladophialophora yegresii CBS 114405]|uniref:Uncharacterized protein n=1 Tax=Cladophialophora yegresii CBS 114405 TaxID=1182544 RepID=W9WNG5_9EURO|nr:uncharacterized protein A1O7_04082 [Cladophialophora yegresii CBS 114405]EXJ59934.1 hypothetical protein A1O7_04082 [Cladophialophora yegresii CBS 114405]
MQAYQQLGSCAPSSREDVYVFAIAPVTNRGLAAITSADELLLLDRGSLAQSNVGRLQGAPVGLTSLVVADQGTAVICAGGDGAVAVFDLRSGSRAAQFKSGMCDCHVY